MRYIRWRILFSQFPRLTKIVEKLEYDLATYSCMTSQSAQSRILLQTDFPELTLHARGKVRDLYSLNGHLLFVATDRISAFDYVLATGIPEKGRVLTQLSLFWFDFLKDVVKNHLVTANVEQYPAPLKKYADDLRGRSMLVTKAQMIDIECVARGYLSGSGWKEYQQSGAVCGIKLPSGLKESDKLPEPIFTPATKALSGHDENISIEEMAKRTGKEMAEKLRDLTLKIYKTAADYAAGRGIIIADTKFEFGQTSQGLILADEVLTPDSSRFWPADKYQPGKAQESFDKQFVRDYLEAIKWNKQPPAPSLPEDVARMTSEKYIEAYRILAGRELPAG
ncbi:MAG TPA: phosphoribosylaminoimidazolesuccinocarboxamide synthase [Candidatus Acidoferrales bacterium]|nr:phosphoribosylaminoimidazolesuccinocarboxamide synthase [Candidatus Acidoferrales bacterium]